MRNDMVIRQIDSNEKQIIKDVVRIHLDTFTGFFLTFMGKGFLTQMYRSYCEHNESNLLAAFDEDGKPVGFLAYSGDMSGLYKYMIKKKLIPFAWFSLGAFLRKPKVFMRLIRALLRPSESERKEKYVMFTSLGVDTTKTCRGAGSMLFNKGKESVDFSKYEYISLETDVENNENTNHFHQKHGFKIFREFKTPEGRRMYEYRYYGPNAPKEAAEGEKAEEATV
jgi:ribosomal protein S18 acetylase RimI-like enzyme